MTRRPGALVAVLLALALLLAGCVAPKQQTSGSPAPDGPTPTLPDDLGPALAPFYGQGVVWQGCDGGFECATVQAPLDWADPAAGSIDLALKRSAATGERIGSLLINPGGPGASGVDLVGTAQVRFGAGLLEAYDVVGFDPRGVGGSSAVDCGPAAVVDPVLTADLVLETEQDLAAARDLAREFGEGCLERTGPLLGHVDTESAARDMDLLRAVLGDERLNYIGFSYGTLLGAVYAELFPERVGRLVLDGALDPSLSADELSIEQARGFESALRAYVTSCQRGADCPLPGDVDRGMRTVAELIDRARVRPMQAADGRELNGTLAFFGVVLPLYASESWTALTHALRTALVEGDPSTLLMLADLYLDRGADGEYRTNQMVAFTAVNCLDYPAGTRDLAGYEAFAAEVAEVAPSFAEFFAYGVGCEVWPFEAAQERGPIAATGAAPILVVGTTNDPATPYAWSQRLAEQLDSGVLLTYEGEGHTAYGRSNRCVADAVEAFLLQDVVPVDGTVC